MGSELRTLNRIQSLVHPVPDGSATDARVGINDIPILLEVTYRVTHGVGIFAHDERTVLDFPGLRGESCGGEIAVVVDVALAAVGVAERQGYAVEGYNSITHSFQVGTYPTLVAHAPEDDTGMVLVALNQ